MTTTDKAAPRACPWCQRGYYINNDDGDGRWRIECDTVRCDAAGPWCATEAEAIAEWNRIRLLPLGEVDAPPRPGKRRKRRKRVGRKKAAAAVDALIDAQIDLDAASGIAAVMDACAIRDAARARLMRMLTGDDGEAKGGEG